MLAALQLIVPALKPRIRNGDGRPEIVIVNMNRTPSLLHNRSRGGNFLNVAVTGTKSNRSGIGARIIVTAGGRKRVSEVMSGGSYYSSNSLVSHFGLGSISTVDQLEIRWPSGLVQKWSALAVNQRLTATEGVEELKRIPQP